MAYFDSFGIENIIKEVKKILATKLLKPSENRPIN